MADILQAGIQVLSMLLDAYASQPITYARGYQSVDLVAGFRKKLLKLDDGFGGIRLEWTDLDLIITAAKLTFDGIEPITPERGDIIYVVIADEVQTFEVLPYGAEPCWRWCDGYQVSMRVHAKAISVEPYS